LHTSCGKKQAKKHSSLGGYQGLVDREVQKTGNLELLKNYEEHQGLRRRVDYIIQTEYSSSIRATLRDLKEKDPSEEMSKAVDDVQRWLVDEKFGF